MTVTLHPAATAAHSSLWFAPRVTARFTRMWFKRSPLRIRLYGGLLFWIIVGYMYLTLMALSVAIWLTAVTWIWVAQLACLPVLAVRSVRHRPIR